MKREIITNDDIELSNNQTDKRKKKDEKKWIKNPIFLKKKKKKKKEYKRFWAHINHFETTVMNCAMQHHRFITNINLNEGSNQAESEIFVTLLAVNLDGQNRGRIAAPVHKL